MLHVALAASVAPHALAPVATAKSEGLVPPIAMLLMFSAALPVLLRVAARAEDVALTVVLGNASAEVSEATGAAAVTPVPVRLADCVVGDALSVTVRVAAYACAAAGLKGPKMRA